MWEDLRNKQLGYQGKKFYTNGGGKYRSKMFADHLRLAYILMELNISCMTQRKDVVQ